MIQNPMYKALPDYVQQATAQIHVARTHSFVDGNRLEEFKEACIDFDRSICSDMRPFESIQKRSFDLSSADLVHFKQGQGFQRALIVSAQL